MIQSVTAERGGGGWGFWVGWFEFERLTPERAVCHLWGVASPGAQSPGSAGAETAKHQNTETSR